MKQSYKSIEGRRYFLLGISTVLCLLIGISYAWSVFSIPFHEKFDWSVSQVSFCYTIFSLVVVFTNLVCIPFIKAHLKVRTAVFLGGASYGLGMILCGLTGSLVLFIILLALLGGFGTGLIFPTLLAYAQRLFPEKNGFASGIVCFGYGMGAVVMAPAINGVLELTGDIVRTFVIVGAVSMGAIFLFAAFIREVPAGFEEEMLEKAGGSGRTPVRDAIRGEKNRIGMIRDPLFLPAYLGLAFTAVCGIIVISQGSPIVQHDFGWSPDKAAVFVSALAVSNTLGRPVAGAVSDRIGKVSAQFLVNVLTLVSMVILVAGSSSVLLNAAAMLLDAFCYGAMCSLISPMTYELWGHRHGAENYGVTFSVFAIMAVLGPTVTAGIFERTGSYHGAFVEGVVLAAIGVILMLIPVIIAKKAEKKEK